VTTWKYLEALAAADVEALTYGTTFHDSAVDRRTSVLVSGVGVSLDGADNAANRSATRLDLTLTGQFDQQMAQAPPSDQAPQEVAACSTGTTTGPSLCFRRSS
jgi:hypothetical protein